MADVGMAAFVAARRKSAVTWLGSRRTQLHHFQITNPENWYSS